MQKTTHISVESQISIYKTLDFCPMFNYYKASETKDYRYLLKLKDYEDLPEYNEDLQPYFESLRDDVTEFTVKNNNRSNVVFDQVKRRDILISDYQLIQSLISYLWYNKDDEKIKMLAECGYKINTKRDYHQELKRIQKRSQILTGRIKYMSDEIEALTSGKTSDMYTEKENVSNYRGRDVDIHKTSMMEWLTMKNKVQNEIAQKKLKHGGQGK